MSPTEDPDDPAFLRRRARELRDLAETAACPDRAAQMIRVAEMYETEADARERGQL